MIAMDRIFLPSALQIDSGFFEHEAILVNHAALAKSAVIG